MNGFYPFSFDSYPSDSNPFKQDLFQNPFYSAFGLIANPISDTYDALINTDFIDKSFKRLFPDTFDRKRPGGPNDPALYKSPAITGTGDSKIDMSLVPTSSKQPRLGKVAPVYGRRKGRRKKKPKKMNRKVHNRVVTQNIRRGRRKNFMSYRNGRLYSVPLKSTVGEMKSYNKISMPRPNCMKMRTSIYLGTLSISATTGIWNFQVTGSGSDTHGQWFFNPANGVYFPTNGNAVTLARMFQTYYINRVSFTFKSLVAPGVTTSWRIVYGFIEDPNLGETFIPGYDSSQSLAKSTILAIPGSSDFPSWVPQHTISPPRKFYSGKKFQVRSNDIDELIITGTNSGAVSLNRMCYAFGMWIAVDGLTPSITTPISDIYMNVDMDFCDLAPIMLYDATGGSNYSTSLRETKNLPSVNSNSTSSDNYHFVNECKDMKNCSKLHVGVINDGRFKFTKDDLVDFPNDDEDDRFLTTTVSKKSSSIKSVNKS